MWQRAAKGETPVTHQLAGSSSLPVRHCIPASWDAILQVVMGSVTLKVGCRYNLQQQKPPAALLEEASNTPASSNEQDSHAGDAAAVPPHHNTILQAVGLDLTRLQDDYQLLNEPNHWVDIGCQ